jgi:hypothetical protein
MEKTETISPEVRNETRMPTLSTPIQHVPEIPSQSNKARRRNKRNTNRKINSQCIPICRQYDSIP